MRQGWGVAQCGVLAEYAEALDQGLIPCTAGKKRKEKGREHQGQYNQSCVRRQSLDMFKDADHMSRSAVRDKARIEGTLNVESYLLIIKGVLYRGMIKLKLCFFYKANLTKQDVEIKTGKGDELSNDNYNSYFHIIF